MTALIVDQIGKDYHSQIALDDVSFAIPEGSCVALIGHNGAGKTTLMKLVLGVIQPTRGRIEALGVDPRTAGKEYRRRIGFLPENVSFHDELTGADTLAFFARLKGASAANAVSLLERVGLTHAAKRPVKTYSKGMRQRLGLAQAILGEPRLLLLDEPTAGLDPLLRHEFFQIIRELTERGTSIILSSHVLTELEARTDLVAILREGKLAAFGDLDTLREGAGLDVTIRVKGNAPVIAGRLNGAFKKTVSSDRETMEITCSPEKKMALLRTLSELGELCADLEVRSSTLDDLYLHYTGRPISTPAERV